MVIIEYLIRCIVTAVETLCGSLIILIAMIALYKLFRNKPDGKVKKINGL